MASVSISIYYRIPAVITLVGTLRIFVGEHRSGSGHDVGRCEVFTGNQLQTCALDVSALYQSSRTRHRRGVFPMAKASAGPSCSSISVSCATRRSCRPHFERSGQENTQNFFTQFKRHHSPTHRQHIGVCANAPLSPDTSSRCTRPPEHRAPCWPRFVLP